MKSQILLETENANLLVNIERLNAREKARDEYITILQKQIALHESIGMKLRDMVEVQDGLIKLLKGGAS